MTAKWKEGIPPIGEPCLFKFKDDPRWEETDIVAKDKTVLWVRGVGLVANHAAHFKCIKTPAEKERDAAIDGASKIIEMAHGSAGGAYKKYCGTLYDAGYRKQSEVADLIDLSESMHGYAYSDEAGRKLLTDFNITRKEK